MATEGKGTFKRDLITSVVCTTILGIIIACSGGGGTNITTPPTSLLPYLFHKSEGGGHSHILPAAANGKPIVGALFFANPPSDIPESLEITCQFQSGFIAGVPPGNLVPLIPAPGGTACFFFASTPQPAGTGPLSGAQPLFHAGTVQTLVVTGVTQGGVLVRCADLTAQAAAADNDFIVPYLNPQTNTIQLFNNITQLGFTCTLAGVPSGDTVARLTVRFAKL